MTTEPEPDAERFIDLTVDDVMRLFGVDEMTARGMLAMERGESRGDVIDLGEMP